MIEAIHAFVDFSFDALDLSAKFADTCLVPTEAFDDLPDDDKIAVAVLVEAGHRDRTNLRDRAATPEVLSVVG